MTSASASFALPSNGALPLRKPTPRMDRRLTIVIAVIGVHVLGLWALQNGLLRRATEFVIPVQLLAETIELPQPQVAPAPEPQPEPKPEPAPPKVQAPRPAPKPVEQAQTVVDPEPIAQAPVGALEPAPVAPPAPSPVAVAEPAPAPAVVPPPAPPKIELPSSVAAYLKNPPPRYPTLSRTLNEQGTVKVSAYIEVDGTASKVQVLTSSGYDRLDEAAVRTILTWRFVPGKRGGVPQAMWFTIPVPFILEPAR
jgi:periplasmic protein TonB